MSLSLCWLLNLKVFTTWDSLVDLWIIAAFTCSPSFRKRSRKTIKFYSTLSWQLVKPLKHFSSGAMQMLVFRRGEKNMKIWSEKLSTDDRENAIVSCSKKRTANKSCARLLWKKSCHNHRKLIQFKQTNHCSMRKVFHLALGWFSNNIKTVARM